jgi:hypothetical protein
VDVSGGDAVMTEYAIGKKRLTYNSETGLFTWPRTNDVAGSLARDGYRKVCVDNKIFNAHKLAWCLVYGKMPTQALDHINGVRDDNRIANLRLATPSENAQNKRSSPAGKRTKAPLGVTFHKKCQKYQAQIMVGGCSHYLGLYETPEDAHAAYLAAKRNLHPFADLTAQRGTS